MPRAYLAMKEKFMAEGLSEEEAEEKAARIYNSKNPKNPVHRGSDKGKSDKKKGD